MNENSIVNLNRWIEMSEILLRSLIASHMLCNQYFDMMETKIKSIEVLGDKIKIQWEVKQ